MEAQALSGSQLLCADLEDILPRRFHLSDAGLLLLTADFSAPANQHQLPQYHKSFTSGSGLLLLTADSPAPADQNPQITQS